MKIPHFFKAKSRMGLINPPMRHTKFNNGVEEAPSYIINQNFLDTLPKYKTSEFIFSKPEDIQKEKYYSKLAEELESFKHLINEKIKPAETQVVIGGDNSVTFSSLLAVIERLKDVRKIGYLQFDSHGEMHLLKTSVSKNFHGMYMRPFFDKFDVEEIENLVPNKLNLNQALTIGDIIFEDTHPDGEKAFYKNIRNINRQEFLQNKSSSLDQIKKFIAKFEHIHINFDIDVFKTESVGPSGMGDEGKWYWEDTLPIIEMLNKKQNISLDIVEVNPLITGAEKTIKTAQQIISLLIS